MVDVKRSAEPRGPRRKATLDTALRDQPWLAHERQALDATAGAVLGVVARTTSVIVRMAWRTDARGLVIAMAAQLGASILPVAGLVVLMNLLDALLSHADWTAAVGAALPAILLLGAIYATRNAFELTSSSALAKLAPRMLGQAETELARAAGSADLADLESPDFHSRLERARHRGVSQVETAVEQAVALLGMAPAILVMTVAVGFLHPLLPVALLLSMAPEAWSAFATARRRYATKTLLADSRRRLSVLLDLLANPDSAAEVKAFNAKDSIMEEHQGLIDSMMAEQVSAARKDSRTSLLGRVLGGLGLVAAYGVLSLLLVKGTIPLTAAGVTILAMRIGRTNVGHLVRMANHTFTQGLYLNDYVEFLALASPGPRTADRIHLTGAPARIEFRQVGFTYPGAKRPAVHDITLTIPSGSTVAVVGENGSGKSTLVKLLCGLYDPDAGRITWDGVDVTLVDRASIADRISLIMQNPTKWPFSLLDVVTMGSASRPDDDELLLDAARRSGVDALAAKLPLGWNTLLTKRFHGGQDLSGGEWQRIGIARALYRDAPILICDEPTAALDARAEAAVYEALKRARHGRTVVFISHRMTSARIADLIIVLRNGEIVEQGSHEELMRAAGHYADLYNIQSELISDEV